MRLNTSHDDDSLNTGALGNAEYALYCHHAHKSTQKSGVVAPDIGPINGLITSQHNFRHITLFERELILTRKMCTYVKINCLKWNYSYV